MGKKSDKFYEVVNDFTKTRSYAETGRNCGVSRQRVHAIIVKSGIDIKPKTAHGQWVGKNCYICGRPLCDKQVAGKCVKCWAHEMYIKSSDKKKRGDCH
jgi:hypothetical protein